jgi:hypothetical protein
MVTADLDGVLYRRHSLGPMVSGSHRLESVDDTYANGKVDGSNDSTLVPTKAERCKGREQLTARASAKILDVSFDLSTVLLRIGFVEDEVDLYKDLGASVIGRLVERTERRLTYGV